MSEDVRPGGTYKTLAEQREVLTPGVGPNAEDTPGDIVFADPVIFLFLGAFVLAKAMITHGLDRMFSFLVLSLHGVGRSTYGVIIAFGAIAVSTSIPVMAGLILA